MPVVKISNNATLYDRSSFLMITDEKYDFHTNHDRAEEILIFNVGVRVLVART